MSERESVCVCACVCKRERERERERDSSPGRAYLCALSGTLGDGPCHRPGTETLPSLDCSSEA